MHQNHITPSYHIPQAQYASALNMPLNSFQPATTIYNQQMLAADVQAKIVYSATQQSAPPPLRSKSVPDILKELNAEVEVSEDKRVRNKSQSRVKGNVDGNANSKGEILLLNKIVGWNWVLRYELVLELFRFLMKV